MKTTAIILFAHGSRNPNWRAPFDQITQHVTQLAPEAHVVLAFLENMSPTLEAAIASSLAQGVSQVQIVPLFFGVGIHLADDLRQMVEALYLRYPQVEFHISAAAGENEHVQLAMARYAVAASGLDGRVHDE